MPEDASRRFRISAAHHELTAVAAIVDAFCSDNQIPPATVNLMHLALDEVLSNIVKYAYGKSDRGVIDVALNYSNRRFSVTVEDAGRPFNPLRSSPRGARGALKDRPHGGLGILFVKNVVDDLAYDRSNDRNRLTLTIRVPSNSDPRGHHGHR